MSKYIVKLVMVLLLLVLVSHTLVAEPFGPLEVYRTNWSKHFPSTTKGTVKNSYRVINSDSKPHTLNFCFKSHNKKMGNGASLTKSVEIPSATTVVIEFPIPVLHYGWDPSLKIGVDQEPNSPLTAAFSRSSNMPTIGLSGGRKYPRILTSMHWRRLETIPLSFIKPLHQSLHDYLVFDVICMSPAEFEKLDGKTKEIIHDYVTIGGCVYLYSSNRSELSKITEKYQLDENARHGLGRFYTSESDSLSHDQLVRDESYIDELEKSSLVEFVKENGESFIPYESFPIKPVNRILFVFTILAGPILLYLLHRLKSKVHFIWLMPLISTLVTVALVTLFIVRDGWTMKEAKKSITYLDQPNQKSYSQCFLGLYSPFTWEGQLRFGKSAMIETNGTVLGFNYEVDSTHGWDINFDNLTAKRPFFMKFYDVKMCRKRLQFYKNDQDITVVNGLGTTVDELRFYHDDQLYTISEPLAAGDSIILEGFLNFEPGPREDYSPLHYVNRKDFKFSKVKLKNNYYFAKINGKNPFYKPFVDEAEQFGESIILGKFEVKE